jgi:hypothetical protein
MGHWQSCKYIIFGVHDYLQPTLAAKVSWVTLITAIAILCFCKLYFSKCVIRYIRMSGERGGQDHPYPYRSGMRLGRSLSSQCLSSTLSTHLHCSRALSPWRDVSSKLSAIAIKNGWNLLVGYRENTQQQYCFLAQHTTHNTPHHTTPCTLLSVTASLLCYVVVHRSVYPYSAC